MSRVPTRFLGNVQVRAESAQRRKDPDHVPGPPPPKEESESDPFLDEDEDVLLRAQQDFKAIRQDKDKDKKKEVGQGTIGKTDVRGVRQQVGDY